MGAKLKKVPPNYATPRHRPWAHVHGLDPLLIGIEILACTAIPPLFLLPTFSGDRLHFGLAAEQAKAEGLRVEMVVVGEDVAIEEPGLAGRRGLAGTALVHKVGVVYGAGGQVSAGRSGARA